MRVQHDTVKYVIYFAAFPVIVICYDHLVAKIDPTRQNTSQPIMSRHQFTQSVIESLTSTYLTKRNAGNNVNPQVRVK
jgi:hypothetical protein